MGISGEANNHPVLIEHGAGRTPVPIELDHPARRSVHVAYPDVPHMPLLPVVLTRAPLPARRSSPGWPSWRFSVRHDNRRPFLGADVLPLSAHRLGAARAPKTQSKSGQAWRGAEADGHRGPSLPKCHGG